MKNNKFDFIKERFGFGAMRLPILQDGSINYEEFTKMIDTFMDSGFNYFDTAHVYHSGQSEIALRECLVKRYPRDSFVLTNKLSRLCFNKEEDLEPLFNKQLSDCGVDYFDFFLMHAQNEVVFEKFKSCRAYEFGIRMKELGKVKHFGLSFHSSAEVLRKILTEYPQVEVVQLQFNYIDFYDNAIQSKACYDVCVEFGKTVLVMEPIKGGSLINLPDEAKEIVKGIGLTPQELALRFVASFDNVAMILSGMSNMDQMKDNVSFMKDVKPLGDKEFEAIDKIREILKGEKTIKCTGCRYCVDGCPKHILIPDLFACYNSNVQVSISNGKYYYNNVHTINHGKASDCIKCGKCEAICPQGLKIRDLLVDVKNMFE